MYHLTCPSCQEKTRSPFIRSGAVVRCAACEYKYRIKSSHFERKLHTGPRTLDETDSVLRSDSVDIEPDEITPVSIDDEGNVVGLSGLSELMRWSDDQANAQSKPSAKQARARSRHSRQRDQNPLPKARRAKSRNKTKSKAKAQPNTTRDDSRLSPRERAIAIKRAKKQKQYILLAGVSLLLIIAGIIVPQFLPGSSPSASETPDPGDRLDSVGDPHASKPNTRDKPAPETGHSKSTDDIHLFATGQKPSPNPGNRFQAPWLFIDSVLPPIDVPTVLTPATEMTHEGWYVMNPPRGSAEASGDSDVELNKFIVVPQSDGMTLLTGSVSNNASQAVANAELHIMLLDSTGNVFAETYCPLALIPPNGKQAVNLSIASRYWRRSRGVRAGVQVTQWADEMNPIPGVRLASTGAGPATTLRVSVKHVGEKPMRSVMILFTANNSNGDPIARFLVNEQNLYIPKDRWLDLVIATPLPEGTAATDWAATALAN